MPKRGIKAALPRPAWMTALGFFLVCLDFAFPQNHTPISFSFEKPNSQGTTLTYHYRMRGEVRLMFFWLGREDVGGGYISFSSNAGENPNRKTEEIEVLFGSDPDQIPGKINRWGYGKEMLTWVRSRQEDSFRLEESRFQGLIRHSAEESLSEVLSNSRQQNSTGRFQYDATDSLVNGTRAHYEVRIFSDDQDFHYRHPERLLSRYETEIKPKPPTRWKTISPLDLSLPQPHGFLSAVQASIGEIVRTFNPMERPAHKEQSAIPYIFNSKYYLLEVRKIDMLDSPHPPKTVKVQYRANNILQKSHASFWLFFDLTGERRGIPSRIVYQPRWWLRIQLNLDRDPSPETKAIMP